MFGLSLLPSNPAKATITVDQATLTFAEQDDKRYAQLAGSGVLYRPAGADDPYTMPLNHMRPNGIAVSRGVRNGAPHPTLGIPDRAGLGVSQSGEAAAQLRLLSPRNDHNEDWRDGLVNFLAQIRFCLSQSARTASEACTRVAHSDQRRSRG